MLHLYNYALKILETVYEGGGPREKSCMHFFTMFFNLYPHHLSVWSTCDGGHDPRQLRGRRGFQCMGIAFATYKQTVIYIITSVNYRK